jgi:methanogenic corrinoid protein MtbC1
VTLALCNLHRLLRERSWTQGPEEHSPIVGLSLLMTTFADEQHVLGAMIVSEIFRRKGWSVTTLAGEPHTKVCAALRSDSYDVLGISAATVSNEKKAAEEIASLRAASCNPDLRVVVGGRAFAEEKELCMRIGADAIADSAEETTSWRPACS